MWRYITVTLPLHYRYRGSPRWAECATHSGRAAGPLRARLKSPSWHRLRLLYLFDAQVFRRLGVPGGAWLRTLRQVRLLH